MKKYAKVLGVMTLLSTLSIPSIASAAPEITVTVDGNLVKFDQPPVIENSRTLVPLRAVFEAMGATVTWDDKTQKITCTLNDNEVTLTVGSTALRINGISTVTLDTPATVINDRTLVPVRAISEGLGAAVDWNPEKNQVIITSPVEVTEEELASIKSKVEQTDGKYTESFLSSDGKIILSFTYTYPKISSSEAGVDSINDRLKTNASATAAVIRKEFLESALKYYKLNGSTEEYKPYTINCTNAVTYQDDEKVSVRSTMYVDTHGTYPITSSDAVVFNLDTGFEMTLVDLVADPMSVLESAEEAMVEKIKSNPSIFFTGAEHYVDMTDASFYLTKEGIVFFFQPYTLAPYSTGVVEITVPYAEISKELDPTEPVKVSKKIVEEKVTAKDGTEILNISVAYPEISGNLREIIIFNDYYQSNAERTVKEMKKEYSKAAEEFYENFGSQDFTGFSIEVTYDVTYNKNNLLCVKTHSYQFTGGAHGNYTDNAIIWDLSEGLEKTLEELARNSDHIMEQAEKAFRDKINADPQGFLISADELKISDAKYYLTNDGVTFFYDPYVIAPYAAGTIEVNIPLRN